MEAPSAQTQVAGVIGDPIRHSLSPTLFNAAFEACGLDWVYVAFEVPEGGAPAALDAVRALGIRGLSVTMPHKAAVAGAVDRLTDEATALGAVNCVVAAPDGSLVGHNTDGAGFLAGLAADAGIDPAGARVAVLGAGGAARAIVAALGGAGAADVAVVNRTPERARDAVAIGGPRCRAAGPDAVSHADLVVNATSIGMAPDPGGLPVDPDLIAPGATVVDIVYHPLETALVAASRARGLAAHNGVGMLIGQAAVAFELWTGVPAPVAAMRAAADRRLAAR